MKKLAISLAITSALGLTACQDTTLEDVRQETKDVREQTTTDASGAYVVFDPGAGVLSIPNDLLYSGTKDFTLELPSEVASKMAGEAVDFSNPESALGALDGWGAQNAFTVALDLDEGISITPATVQSGDAVALYQVLNYPVIGHPTCGDPAKAGLACQGVDKLTFGIDYVTELRGNNIVVAPLKPFKAGATYMLALTKEIKDKNDNPLRPSSTYASVEQDLATKPIVDASVPTSELDDTKKTLRFLQTMYNSFEDVLERDFGADGEAIVYTQAFTIQSAGVAAIDPLQIVKKLNAAAMAALPEEEAAVPFISQGFNAASQIFTTDQINAALANPTAAASAPVLLYSAADVYGTQIKLPYYLDSDEEGHNPLTGRWEAACDSGIALASLTTTQLAALEAAVPAEKAASHAACKSFGLADYGIDTERHLTKYNPVPVTKSIETVGAMMTLPNVTFANMLRMGAGLPAIEKPEDGWPIVILQHGITSKKENMIANVGFLSMFGFATISIDHPLHGDRGFEIDNGDETTTTVNATTADPTHYLNLQSLLTARDNLRQSAADTLQLRLAINGLINVTGAVDAEMNIVNPAAIDTSAINNDKVFFMGHSLGAITGHNTVAIANTEVTAQELLSTVTEAEITASAGLFPEGTPNDFIAGEIAKAKAKSINDAYKIEASVLANPGASIANFLTESGAFGPLVKASVAMGLGGDVTATMQNNLVASCGFAPASPTDLPTSTQLGCAYLTLEQTADAQVIAEFKAGLAQFAFAAQAAIEAGDPTSYTPVMKNSDSAILMFEMVGDIEEGGENQPDQVVPNSVLGIPFAGTTGLANQLELPVLSSSSTDSTGKVSGIIKFTKGSHSTMAIPDTELTGAYPAQYALVNQELQAIMAYYFQTEGKSILINSAITDNCAIFDTIKGGDSSSCGN